MPDLPQLIRMVNRILAVALLCVMVACGGSGSSGGSKTGTGEFIFASDPKVIQPFVWFFSDFDNSDAGFDAQLAYGDPMRVTTLLIQDWVAHHDLDTMKTRVAKVVDKWHLDQPGGKLTYLFPYGNIPAGWWSGMDSWSFPMLLIGVWQETKEPSFKDLADKLIAIAAKPVADGGVVWQDGNGCWLSEYVWPGMSESDEYHVLNGHLYALEAVRLIANATQRSDLQTLYECAVTGTKAKAPDYKLQDRWLRYMLNPSVINQTHYVIFETMQFDALAGLDSDTFFSDQATEHRRLLQSYFPVNFVSSGGTSRLMMSAIGAPHPYSIDTYPLYLSCSDGVITEDHSIPRPGDTAIPVEQRAFMNDPTLLNPDTAHCTVESRYVDLAVRLFDAPVTKLSNPVVPGAVVGADLSAILDAYMTNSQTVVIDPSRRVSPPGDPENYLDTQGRMTFSLPANLGLDSTEYLGIDFGANGPLAVGVTLVSGGVEYFRYYPKTDAGDHTLILLSPIGFDGGEAIRSIQQVTVYFYTDAQTQIVTLTNPRLIKFANQAEIQQYFVETAPTFHTE